MIDDWAINRLPDNKILDWSQLQGFADISKCVLIGKKTLWEKDKLLVAMCQNVRLCGNGLMRPRKHTRFFKDFDQMA